MAVQQSMCRDLFTAFMEWLGFLPRAEILARCEGMQPRPLSFSFVHVAEGTSQERTIISRIWRASDAKRCQLCAKCSARYVGGPEDRQLAECLIAFPGYVGDAQLPLYAQDVPKPVK